MGLVVINDTETLIGLLYFLFDRFLSGDVRVRGSRGGGGGVRVRILEVSSTIGKYSSPIVAFHG